MKRMPIAIILCLCLLVTPALAVERLPEDAVSVRARGAVLMDLDTGTLLYEKNAHEQLPPASVTKVMTMLLVAEAVDGGQLALTDTVTASARASSMGGSQIWLKEGEQMSVEEMLKCVAVVSANDCAVALAERLCGSEEAFARAMNEKAAALGLEDSHFTNCTGLFDDDSHYTSAYDLAVLSRALLQHRWITDYTTIWMDSIRGGAFGLNNTNRLLRSLDGAIGLKTGFTQKAGYCLAGAAERESGGFVAVVLGAESSAERFADCAALLEQGFANYTAVHLTPPQALPPVPVTLGTADSVQPLCPEEKTLLEKRQVGALEYSVELPESVQAPVEAGQQLGTLRVTAGEELVAELPLTAAEAVPAQELGQLFWQLLGRFLGMSGGSIK